MGIFIYINFQVSFRVVQTLKGAWNYVKRELEIKHFQLTKYKIFLRNGALPPCNPRQGASPLNPHIIFLLLAGV